MDSGEGHSPPPGDDAGWRRVIEEKRLATLRIEDVVAAAQTLGLTADESLVGTLMIHVSNELNKALRGVIGRNHPNQGHDMMKKAHDKLIDAVLKPSSADGEGLRAAFHAWVRFRAADAIAEQRKHSRRYSYAEDLGSRPSEKATSDASPEEVAYVERILAQIKNPRKRLAFRLHMEEVPKESKRAESIAKALGISAKTAGDWISEVQDQLKTIVGDQS